MERCHKTPRRDTPRGEVFAGFPPRNGGGFVLRDAGAVVRVAFGGDLDGDFEVHRGCGGGEAASPSSAAAGAQVDVEGVEAGNKAGVKGGDKDFGAGQGDGDEEGGNVEGLAFVGGGRVGDLAGAGDGGECGVTAGRLMMWMLFPLHRADAAGGKIDCIDVQAFYAAIVEV